MTEKFLELKTARVTPFQSSFWAATRDDSLDDLYEI